MTPREALRHLLRTTAACRKHRGMALTHGRTCADCADLITARIALAGRAVPCRLRPEHDEFGIWLATGARVSEST